ncbi:MAG: hypothetical protein ACSHWW_05150 [Nonlabens sp.]|uniref:hypothetical protein n=1 Tax=Nonlabens sp. TaxID=1888209 RepID=UPI003EF93DB0
MSNYFIQYRDYFWKWDRDITDSIVVEIPGVGTLIYEQPLRELLIPLAISGLPQFGSIIIILVATNEHIESEGYETFKSQLAYSLETAHYGHHYVENVLTIMEYVHNLPRDLRTGDNLIYLLEVLFENSHNKNGIQKSKQILSNTNVINAVEANYTILSPTKSTYDKDTRAIALMVRRFKSMQDIIDALTSIPIINEEEQLVTEMEPVYNPESSIVEQLLAHSETSEIGSLIKRIWSGLHIPMHQNASSEQPLGGVSDITNKGDMNKLLISEFAYDQDTFLSRVANKEALYIERETANEDNDNRRVFLIDSSLKNWGIPKILSFATALAIANHPKSTFEYAAYVIGDTVREVNFNDILEIISSQQLLSAQLDPAVGLHYFFENEYETRDEVFFLTTSDTLESNDLQYVISERMEQLNYLITTSSSGDVDFYRYRNRSRKHLKQIYLPYEELWADRQTTATPPRFIKNLDFVREDALLTPLFRSEAHYLPYHDQVYIVQNGHLYTFTSHGVKKGLELVFKNVIVHPDSAYLVSSPSKNALIFHEYNACAKAYYKTSLETGVQTSHRKYSKNIEGKCELFEIGKKIVVAHNEHYYHITEEKIEKIRESKNDFLTRFQSKKEDQIKNWKQLLGNANTKYNVLKNIERITIINFYNELIPQFNKFYLNTRVNILGDHNSDYRFLNDKDKLELTPVVDLYLKRIGNVEHISFLQKQLDISLKEAKEFAYQLPTVIKTDIEYKKGSNLKTRLESRGMTCFIKIKSFQTADGSTISIQNGKLYFQSNRNSKLDFCMTAILNQPIAFASKHHFSGNQYFLPAQHALELLDYKTFRQTYINPFFESARED